MIPSLFDLDKGLTALSSRRETCKNAYISYGELILEVDSELVHNLKAVDNLILLVYLVM